MIDQRLALGACTPPPQPQTAPRIPPLTLLVSLPKSPSETPPPPFAPPKTPSSQPPPLPPRGSPANG